MQERRFDNGSVILSLAALAEFVCENLSLDLLDLIGTSRKSEFSKARTVIFSLVKYFQICKDIEVSHFFSRDRTTLLRASTYYENNIDVKEIVTKLKCLILSEFIEM